MKAYKGSENNNFVEVKANFIYNKLGKYNFKLKNYINSLDQKKQKRLLTVSFVLIFAVIGLMALIGSRADSPTPYTNISASKGSLAGGACTVTDPSTLDDEAVKFGGCSDAAPINSIAPTITGTPEVGQVLTTSTGSWTNTPTNYIFQWQRCTWLADQCTNISGSTASSYTLTSADAGHRLLAIVTASNSSGSTTALPDVDTQAIAASSYRTFYISYTNGSDSNNGTSTSTPWKRAPGMQGFAGSYTALAGDHFIFEGGDTWPASVFPLNTGQSIGNSGTATASYYYGSGDHSWYLGSSWSMPIFNAQNNAIGSFIQTNPAGYPTDFVEVDGIHFTNFYWSGAPGYNGAVMVDFVDGSNDSVTDSQFDNWSHGTCPSGDSSLCDTMDAVMANEGSILVQGDQFDQSTNSNDYDSGTAVYDGSGVYDHDTCFDIENCFETSGNNTVSNNLIYQVGVQLSYDSGAHTNAIELLGGNDYIYNNTIHDIGLGTEDIDWQSQGTNYIYNNVMWNTNNREPLNADCSFGGCNAGTSLIYNNTLVGDTTGCARFINRGSNENVYLNITEHNNFCISGNFNDIDSGASITNLISNNNLVESTSTASAQGYTASDDYSPESANSPTVGVGMNLYSKCSGDVQWLCSGILGNSRSTNGNWDDGAY